MPDTTVKYFDSAMSGAPTLSGTAGALIGVLDACLVNGFGSVTLTSLVVASNVATATCSGGHHFAMVGNVGPVITIAGATPSGLNGSWRVTVTSSTQFTFATSGISDQTATGTITAVRSSAGWTKAYTGTNKAAYSRGALEASAMLLRVDDTPAQYPTFIMYESMSDVDTGSGASTTRYFAKSNAASGTGRAWTLVADEQAFYLFAQADGSLWLSALAFGDIVPFNSADAFCCLLLGHAAADTVSHLHFVDGTTTGAELARAYSQVGGKVSSGRYSHRTCQYMGAGTLNLPNWADNGLHAWPVECREGTTIARGLMPGLFCPIHGTLMTQGAVVAGNRSLLFQSTFSANYQCALDLTGPWR